MKPVRILLVDDHRIVREGVRSVLGADPRFIVVGEAATGAEALRLVKMEQPDAVLLDLKLPDASGAELCQRIIDVSPTTAVLIFTAYFDHHLVNACLRAGARGYLLKDTEQLNLPDQILAVVHGHAALDPRAASVLIEHIRQQPPPADLLSPRELEILRLIAQGLTNREIAIELIISENTVKGYIKEIFSKLEVHNRIEAVIQARERGLL